MAFVALFMDHGVNLKNDNLRVPSRLLLHADLVVANAQTVLLTWRVAAECSDTLFYALEHRHTTALQQCAVMAARVKVAHDCVTEAKAQQTQSCG